MSVIDNGVSNASQVGLPMSLFAGSDITVSPTRSVNPNAAYAVRINIPGEGVTNIEYNTPAELRFATTNLLNNSSQIQSTVLDKLFK